jgi:hypothetical protein
LEKYCITAVCSKCNETKVISHFIGRKGEWVVINKQCMDCRTMPKERNTRE